MQQFSTTLAGSHSPHDQSNSLSLFLSPSSFPWTASDMRLALLLMRNCSLCVANNLQLSIMERFRHILTCFYFHFHTVHTQICLFWNGLGCPVNHIDPGEAQFQHQGQRPVSPVWKVRLPTQISSWAMTPRFIALIPHTWSDLRIFTFIVC